MAGAGGGNGAVPVVGPTASVTVTLGHDELEVGGGVGLGVGLGVGVGVPPAVVEEVAGVALPPQAIDPIVNNATNAKALIVTAERARGWQTLTNDERTSDLRRLRLNWKDAKKRSAVGRRNRKIESRRGRLRGMRFRRTIGCHFLVSGMRQFNVEM
jgi:hypothetical protein